MDGRAQRRDTVSFVAGLALIAVSTTMFVHAFLERGQSLGHDGPWYSTKTTLARPVPGTMAFVTDRQTLSGGYLNLHAWFGFHEVVSRLEFASIRSIEVDFALGERGWLVALFDRTADGGWRALRLSKDADVPSAVLHVSRDGEFLEQRPFEMPPLLPGELATARLAFGEDEVTVEVAGSAVGSFPRAAIGPSPVGFRGGRRPAVVDGVRIAMHDGSRYAEGFERTRERWRTAGLTTATVCLLVLVTYAALRRRWTHRSLPLGAYFLTAALPLLTASVSWWAFVKLDRDRYPAVSEARMREEDDYRWGTLEKTRQAIREGYDLRDARHGYDPARALRVLLVGGSQAWGQGASRDHEILSEVLRNRLQRRPGPPGRSIESINASAPGARVGRLRAALEQDWLGLAPDVVVLNVSSNDMETGPSFAVQVRAMVDAIEGTGARALLVKEAHSPSAVPGGLRARHRDLERIAADTGAPLFDMHGYLALRDDDGFLWWDMVHLTSLGQRYAAEALADWIERLGLLDVPVDPDDRGPRLPAGAVRPV